MSRTRFIGCLSGMCIALPLIAGGCVDQAKYDQLVMANRSLNEQLVGMEDERDTARANLDTVRGQLAKATTELNGLKLKYNLVDADMQKLLKEYDDMMGRVRGLDFGPLPEEMSAALQALASQYPDILTFDAKKGMLRFASDFTFALGSADLTSSAAASLSKLATILNTTTAQGFEVRVVGHTDNVPVSRPETRAKHPTNWHLSSHRAISVASSLMTSGVSANRFQVAGYGEYRPVVPNPSRGGAAQNRRVEIFLLPMPDYVPTSPATVTATVTTPSLPSEPMK